LNPEPKQASTGLNAINFLLSQNLRKKLHTSAFLSPPT
jgi:hypothetical protein